MHLLLCLGMACSLVQQGGGSPAKAAVNTLTPQEVADGWLLLFDGATDFGWKTEGDVKIKDGTLLLNGQAKEAVATFQTPLNRYELRFELNGKPVTKTRGPSDSGDRFIAFRSKSTDSIRNIKLRPLEMKPLFNGKDLAGWKEFPGKKSVFSVTKEGWLNVKNGAGDLRTEGQYGDFVLQFDCISNGKALNSGIFFRCIAEQYQNGYETQIQNGFKDGDRTKPADFGTGAIYRRIPARKVVSNDHEWFTMTVAAHQKHIATWVNGYQVVDWTDDRPADENPRKGSRTEKGHISIQGHDPTTDLSFRRILISE